jgi:hypothetical protein
MQLVNRAYSKLLPETKVDLKTYTTVVIRMLEGIGRYELPGGLSSTGNSGETAKIIKKYKLNPYCVIVIPPKALFRLESTIFALSHEAGHFIRLSDKVISYWAMLSTLLYSNIFYENQKYKDAYDRERKRGFQTIKKLENEEESSSEKNFHAILENETDIKNTEKKDLLDYLQDIKKFLYEFIADVFAVHSVVLKPNKLNELSSENKKRLKEIYNRTLDANLPASEVKGVHRELRKSAIAGLFIRNKNGQGDIFNDDSVKTLKKWIYESPMFRPDDLRRWTQVVSSSAVADAFYHFQLKDAFSQYTDEIDDMPSQKHREFKQNYFTKANSDAFGLMHDFLDTYQ